MSWAEYLSDAQDEYARTGLWSDSCMGDTGHESCQGDDCDVSLDSIGYTLTDIHPESRLQMDAEVKDWFDMVLVHQPEAFTWWDAAQFGTDFWLTRNGHGAGYWDSGYPGRPEHEIGKWLTEHCKPYGECRLWVDPDNDVQYEG